jgi:acetylornithine deacetylase
VKEGELMNQVEKRVLQAIDVEGMLDFLCGLIAVPSLVGDEVAGQEHVATQMERSGLEVDLWELDFDKLSQHPFFSIEEERGRGLGLVGVTGEDRGGGSLILNGHVDVVPVGDEGLWHYPPWQGTVAGGRVYGRGSVDMKGGLCCALFAAKALHDAQIRLKGRLMVESVIGEEDGGVGTLATILRGYRADGAIVCEPTQLTVAPAQAGAFNFRVTIPGKAAHGCVREEGVSPIEKFIPIHEALMDLERQRNQEVKDPLYSGYELPFALCIGNVRAGTWASSVAESLVFEGRYGIAPGEDQAVARHAFERTVAEAAQGDPWLREHPPVVEWWGGQFYPTSTPVEHALVRTMTAAFEEVSGRSARIEGMTYGADMGLLVNVGHTPTVLFGPGDVRVSHRPDEQVPIDELEIAARTLALAALRFCGYQA